MRKEFNELVETMKRWDLFHKDDEVDVALTNLSNKIDEVEKRIECAVRSANEANQSISKYTERVDESETFKMEVTDHDSILRGSNDVIIALDMGDTECVEHNWYNLFSPKESEKSFTDIWLSEETYPIVNCMDCGHPQPLLEENVHVDELGRHMVCEQCEGSFNVGGDEIKPIAVGNIEYDFPEEVYSIGNADNSVIIGDVYESVFNKFVELGIIVFEGSENFNYGKANYTINDNGLIGMVVANQIDLSKVPIKKEVFMTFHSSWGEIDCDVDGNVIEVRGDEDDDNYLFDIAVFDLAEYYTFLNSKNITMGEADDVLAVGFWKKDNTYHEAEKDWRKEIFGEEPPTELCKTPQTHEFVKDIIAKLKVIDVDGETMEYILKQVGMDEQIFKQLFERQG
jgi:hypothetical protein